MTRYEHSVRVIAGSGVILSIFLVVGAGVAMVSVFVVNLT
jgi:hypothetical protein